MKLTKFEKTMLWIFGIAERIKDAYLKCYPYCAGVLAIIIACGYFRKADNGRATTEDLYAIIAIAVMFTILTLVYLVIYLREKLREARLNRWLR